MTLQRLTDPTAVVAAMAEFDRLGRTAFLAKYEFGKAREYMLRSAAGILYDSKAIVGAAFGIQFPEEGPLGPDDFSGGESTVERKLLDLGFDVVRIGHDWTPDEVEAAVLDYLTMLELEARGSPYNKSEHNAALRTQLVARSKGSVELKHQNISAALDELGLPFIKGYKPRSNFQDLIRDVVREQIGSHRDRFLKIVDDLEAVKSPSEQKFAGVLVSPPIPAPLADHGPQARIPRKLDYAARDERNRILGRDGEQWVLGYEAHRLIEVGRPDSVERICWVSDTEGDGLGYDIRSSSDGDDDRYIEVKTTNSGALTPFIISANELTFSKEAGSLFFLYRVFEYSSIPHLYMLQGDLEARLSLRPIDYRARLKAL